MAEHGFDGIALQVYFEDPFAANVEGLTITPIPEPTTALLLGLGLPAAAGMEINPRFFGFSTYLGPIVNLSYSDPSVLRVAKALRMGSLRYPGGSTANSWNLSSGRWVRGHGDWAAGPSPWAGSYANNTALLPEGTFTPKAFMDGIGELLQAAPIWNLNLVSLPDAPSQLDTLKQMGVPVEMVELGNEDADQGGKPRGKGDPAAYLKSAAPVVARTRALFPRATISVIGCFGDPWGPCSAQLKAAYERSPRLFDAVTIHRKSDSFSACFRVYRLAYPQPSPTQSTARATPRSWPRARPTAPDAQRHSWPSHPHSVRSSTRSPAPSLRTRRSGWMSSTGEGTGAG